MFVVHDGCRRVGAFVLLRLRRLIARMHALGGS